MLNHGSLAASSASSHSRPASDRASSASISAACAVREDLGHAAVDRQPRELAQLGVGPEEHDVDPRDHLRDVLVGDVRQRLLAEVREGQVGAVAEQQELEVVLPHALGHAQHARVGVEHLVEARVLVAEDHRVGLVLGQRRHLGALELGEQRLHLGLPALVELVPVLEVVARALLEELRALGDLLRVGDRVDRDVDVAVDDAVVDAHRRRDREGAVLPGAERVVRAVDRGDVEGRHRHREVHRVPEPQAAGVGLRARLLKERKLVSPSVLSSSDVVRRYISSPRSLRASRWTEEPEMGMAHPGRYAEFTRSRCAPRARA
jgi:hypothetical protein